MLETDTAAQQMIDALNALDDACGCNDPDEVSKCLIPIRQATQEELAYTLFDRTPCHTQVYEFPYLKPDGTPLGGFGKQHALTHVYDDGTAIAILRCWKYDYTYDHEHKGCLDGNPVKCPGPMQNEMTIRFYLLGCNHEYREGSQDEANERGITLLSMDHIHICDKCGHYTVFNSSD